ncbi:hypothetical protein AB3538_16285 [Acinetobacter baumannii]
MQHWALDRQLEWIVLDQNRGLEIESYYQKDIYVNLRNV